MQLTLQGSMLYCNVNYPSMLQEKLLIVAFSSLQRDDLQTAHEKIGHKGTDKTMVQNNGQDI